MGASAWHYFVPYQPDLGAALRELRQRVLDDGDYWWAGGAVFTPASAHPDRPKTLDELFADERVQASGTHSILDMHRVLDVGETPDYGTVEPVTADEARRFADEGRLTRDHVDAIDDLADRRWFGRCAVLHEADGRPAELYFWGYSGD